MSLKNRIDALAEEFSAGVLAAIRSASLEEILAESGAARRAPAPRSSSSSNGSSGPSVAALPVRRGPGRPPGTKNKPKAAASAPAAKAAAKPVAAKPSSAKPSTAKPSTAKPSSAKAGVAAVKAAKPKFGKGGRLARRSPEQIAQVVETLASALKKSKSGMRSEQLQKLLGLDKKEISGPLNEALAAKKITKKGERRATTYFAR